MHVNTLFNDINSLAITIGEHTQRGKKAFKRLQEHYPDKVDLLHKHAGFLSEVCNEEKQAEILKRNADFLRRKSGGHRRSSKLEISETGISSKAGE
jgi:hypothetical protein